MNQFGPRSFRLDFHPAQGVNKDAFGAKTAPRILSAAEIKEAISKKRLLPAALSDRERTAEANRLMALAREGLNGFASKLAEASGIPIISPADSSRFQHAYSCYAEAAGLYNDVLALLVSGSDEAAKVKQLLIDAHEFGRGAINCNIEAVELAPKEKQRALYSLWEGRATEAIQEISKLRD